MKAIQSYDDLTEVQQNELSKAWQMIYDGLSIYETITGAYNLDDIIYEELWDTINYQKMEEQS